MDFLQQLFDFFKDRLGKRQTVEVLVFALLLTFVAPKVAEGTVGAPLLLALFACCVLALWYVGVTYGSRWRVRVLVLAGIGTVALAFWLERHHSSDARRGAATIATAARLAEEGLLAEATQRLGECKAFEFLEWRLRLECTCALGHYRVYFDRDAARKDLLSCYALAVEKGSTGEQARALCGIGELEYLTDRYEVARQQYADALALAQQGTYPEGTACAHFGLGALASRLGDFPSARRHLDLAANTYRSMHSAKEAEVQQALGEIDAQQGRYPDALRRYEEALSMFKRLGDPNGQAGVEASIADVARRQGDLEKARESYKRALGTFQKNEYGLGQANVLLGLGAVELVAHRYDLAGEYMKRALDQYEALHDEAGKANVLVQWGHVDRKMDQLDSAREKYKRARTICERIADVQCEGNALLGLGQVEQRLGSPHGKERELHVRLAQEYYSQARDSYSKGRYALGAAKADFLQWALLMELGRRAEAEAFRRRALETYSRLGMGFGSGT